MSVVLNVGSTRLYKNDVTLRASGDLRLSVSGNKIIVGNAFDLSDLEDTIVASVLKYYNDTGYILKIAGASAMADGSIFLLGSECDNVDFQYDEATKSTKLKITDVCPACKTCDAIAELRQNLEELELFYNAIKDAQLYTSGVVADRFSGLYNNNTLYLSNTNLAKTFCSTLPGHSDYTSIYSEIALPAFDLLSKYAVLMHMWNFAVKDLTTSNTVSGTGAAVQIATSHAFTYCEQKPSATSTVMNLECEITLGPVSVQDNLSVYVPEATVSGASPGSSGINSYTSAVSSSEYTTKIVKIEINATQAGTYAVQQNFIPFIWGETTVKDEAGKSTAMADATPVIVPSSCASTKTGSNTPSEAKPCIDLELRTEETQPSGSSQTTATYAQECPATARAIPSGTNCNGPTIRDASDIYMSWQPSTNTGSDLVKISGTRLEMENLVSVGTQEGSTTTYSQGYVKMPTFISSTRREENPTKEFFESGNNFIAKAVSGSNRWRITIVWRVKKGAQTETLSSETYFMQTKCCPTVAD